MTTRDAKRPATWALIACMGVATVALGACTSGDMGKGNMGDNDDMGWLSGYQPDKNNDGSWSKDEVDAAFNAADTNGDGSLDAGERAGGGRR